MESFVQLIVDFNVEISCYWDRVITEPELKCGYIRSNHEFINFRGLTNINYDEACILKMQQPKDGDFTSNL